MRQDSYEMEQAEQIVKRYLQKEQEAGIPSIPESLKPGSMEMLLEKQRNQRKPGRYLVPGGAAALAAAAVVFLIIPFMQGKVSMDTSVSYHMEEHMNIPETTMSQTKAASTSDENYSAQSQAAVTEEVVLDGGQNAVESSETGEINGPQIEGSYQTACLEKDTLYLLQKTEVYKLYQIPLANPWDWQQYTLSVSPEENVTEIYLSDGILYLKTEAGKTESITIIKQ